MKNFSAHFLILTIITAALGFSGLEFPGDTIVRVLFLIAAIGLLVSCLDAVWVRKSNTRDRIPE